MRQNPVNVQFSLREVLNRRREVTNNLGYSDYLGFTLLSYILPLIFSRGFDTMSEGPETKRPRIQAPDNGAGDNVNLIFY